MHTPSGEKEDCARRTGYHGGKEKKGGGGEHVGEVTSGVGFGSKYLSRLCLFLARNKHASSNVERQEPPMRKTQINPPNFLSQGTSLPRCCLLS